MIVTDHLVYLQMQKTGSSFVERMLVEFAGGVQYGKHQRLPGGFDVGERLIVGSVRNPWAWYLSLWSYGCAGKGSLHGRLTQRLSLRHHGSKTHPAGLISGLWHQLRNDSKSWQALYRSADDIGAFREWLQRILGPDEQGLLGYGYAQSPIATFAGLYSYRLAFLYLRSLRDLHSPELRIAAELADLLVQRSQLDQFIRLEHLRDDLLRILAESGQAAPEDAQAWLKALPAINSSSRPHPIQAYYDSQTFAQVRERDLAPIEHFGYADVTLESLDG